MWGESRLIYALVAYITRDWRLTFEIINLVSLPVLWILTCTLVVESPRWLHAKGYNARLNEVQEWMSKINHSNANEFTAVHRSEDQKLYTYRDLFASPEMRKRSALCAFIWFSCTFISYGLDLQSGELPGDRFTNQFIISGVLALTKPLIFFVDAFFPGFNRRRLHQFSIAVPTLCIAGAAVLTALESTVHGAKTGLTVLSIIGMIVMEYQFDAAYLYCMELFPTVCRGVGFAFSNFVGRFGNVIAPQAIYLGTVWKPAPLILFACLGVVVLIISVALLPDTKESKLPDSLTFREDEPEETELLEKPNPGEL